MSTQNIKILSKCEIIDRFDKIFVEESTDIMKYFRFDLGKLCPTKIKLLNLYYSVIHQNYCNLTEEELKTISEQIFEKFVLDLKLF